MGYWGSVRDITRPKAIAATLVNAAARRTASRLCIPCWHVETLTNAFESCALLRTHYDVAILLVIRQHSPKVRFAEVWKVFPEMLNTKRRRNRAFPGKVKDLICKRFRPHLGHGTTDSPASQESIMSEFMMKSVGGLEELG